MYIYIYIYITSLASITPTTAATTTVKARAALQVHAMRTCRPEVLSVQLPGGKPARFAHLVENLWALDAPIEYHVYSMCSNDELLNCIKLLLVKNTNNKIRNNESNYIQMLKLKQYNIVTKGP